MTKSKMQLEIYLSAIAVAVGAFLPLAQLPIYGEVSYNRIAPLESYLLIACVAIAPALLIAGKGKLVVLPVLGAWLILLFPKIQELVNSQNISVIEGITDPAAEVMQDFAANLLFNMTEFLWGGFVFLGGLVVFTLSSLWLRKK